MEESTNSVWDTLVIVANLYCYLFTFFGSMWLLLCHLILRRVDK